MKQLYNFSSDTNTRDWLVVNDGVMGGVSNSQLSLTKEGHGLFKGQVSLDNNGGFASIQLRTNFAVSDKHEKIVMRIKGDGKPYEFRLKGSNSQRESYVQPFTTSGEWQTIELQIADFYPQFRGRKLNLPNFDFDQITQVSFLIANKKEEYFELLIDWVGVE
ncbi:MAG: CIA30 family protein [Cyclobacteriaceae bacterium]|nr:CIA30 family protein [Cyclobacteriaceae bacterium]